MYYLQFPGIPADLDEIGPPIHKNGRHTAERRLPQNNENDANAESSLAVLEDEQIEVLIFFIVKQKFILRNNLSIESTYHQLTNGRNRNKTKT